MGNFVLHIEAVGNHGCQRDKKAGTKIEKCADPSCSDCNIRTFLEDFSKRNSIVRATLTHWPDGNPTVTDNLKTGVRQGNF